jgi:hypothetical protein
MPKETYAQRGRVVRSDEAPEERRDAARRRFERATGEFREGIKPAVLIKRSPGVAVGAGVVGLLVVRRVLRGLRGPRVVTVVRNVGPVPVMPASSARMERAAEKGANKSTRNMIIGAVMTALVGVLRERVLAPNIEKYVAPRAEQLTETLMARFTGGRKDEKKPQNGQDNRASTTYRS